MPGGFGRALRVTAGLAMLAAVCSAALPAFATTWHESYPRSCYAGVYTVPDGASHVEITAIGQHGQTGAVYSDGHAPGAGGLGGMVTVVAAVTPGQKLWAAPGSSLFDIHYVSNGGGGGGYASFVATVDPGAACPSGSPAVSSLLVVAGGGGGGASGSYRGSGGSGANAGPNGGAGASGGNNNQVDGGGGGGGTQSGGGGGGAAGHSNNVLHPYSTPGGAGGYFAGGNGACDDSERTMPICSGGGGGAGYYGGGGGGADRGGGAGGGGGGSNYIAPSIPSSAPTDNQLTGTLINGNSSGAETVQITPIFTTTTTINAAPNPSTLGQQVTITATVASSSGGAPAGGDVKIYDGTTLLGTVSSSGGMATLQTSSLAQGTHYLQAIYQGFANDDEIQGASAAKSTNVGGLMLPYQQVVGAAPPSPVAPVVTMQPTSQGARYGDATVYFQAQASGVPSPAIQWQVSSDNGATFTNTSGSGGWSADHLAITPTVAISGNQYRAVFTNALGSVTSSVATLSVSTAALAITANDRSIGYLSQIPALDASFGAPGSGTELRNGDTPDSLDGYLVCTAATATANSLPGTYPIICSGVSSPNYTITFKPGTLTIRPPMQTIVVDGNAPQTPPLGGPVAQTFMDVDMGTSYAITAHGGDSNQPISFAVSPAPNPDASCSDSKGQCTDVVEDIGPRVCSVTTTGDGTAVVSFNAVRKQYGQGFCFVNINQAGATVGGAMYPPAAEVQLDFKIHYGAPSITTQPMDQSVSAGQIATFTITATGVPAPTLQWQVSTDMGATFSDIPGATASTLTLANTQPMQSGNRYRALVSNNPSQSIYYLDTDLISNVAVLTVSSQPGPPYVRIDPTDTTVMDSTPVTFTAVGGGNPQPADAQWQVSTDGGASYADMVIGPPNSVGLANVAGGVSATLRLGIPSYNLNGNFYRAVFTNANGSATSQGAKLTVLDRLLIINNGKPADLGVALGQAASFSVDIIAWPAPTFQWQTLSGGVWTDIPGATARTLNLVNVNRSMSGSQYQVVVTQGDPFNLSATSHAATLIVTNAMPTLTPSAVSSVMFGTTIGDSATLAGGYNPSGTLTFTLYGDADTSCSGTPVFTSHVNVSGNASLSSLPFTPASVGTYRWTIDYSGDANNDAVGVACNVAGQTVVVTKDDQAINFGAAPSVKVGGNGTVTATGGASGNAVAFASTSAQSICIVGVDGLVTGMGVGSCAVTADQAGNANYNRAPQATQTVAIGKGDQTITFGATPDVNVGGSGTVTATGGASGNAVTFGTSSTADICTVSTTGNVAGVGAGNCIVTANQIGDANYNDAAQATQTVAIGKGDQTITFGATPSVNVGGSGTVTATGGASGNAVTFATTSASSICTVSTAGAVAGVGVGNCIVTADQAGDANYDDAPQLTQTVAIGKAASTVSLTSSANPAVYGQPVEFTATLASANTSPSGTVDFTDGGLPIADCSAIAVGAGQAICGVASLAVGPHAIAASYSGDANTTAASTTISLSQVLDKAMVAISLSVPTSIDFGNSVTVNASVAALAPGAGSATGTIVVDDGLGGAHDQCTITLPATSCLLTPTGLGTLTLTAHYSGDGSFASDTLTAPMLVTMAVVAVPALSHGTWVLLALLLMVLAGWKLVICRVIVVAYNLKSATSTDTTTAAVSDHFRATQSLRQTRKPQPPSRFPSASSALEPGISLLMQCGQKLDSGFCPQRTRSAPE